MNRHILIIALFFNLLASDSYSQSVISLDDRLLYDVPGNVRLDEKILSRIDDLVEDAIQQKAMPGCQILVAKESRIVLEKVYGYYTYDSLIPVTTNTIYDLASITKVLATTQAIMYLVENDSIDLDTPLSDYIPYLLVTNKEDITIREVLAHHAGLYPYFPFWKKASETFTISQSGGNNMVKIGDDQWVTRVARDSIIHWASNSYLVEERFDTLSYDQYIYSDIGYYFLQDIIELKTGQNFAEFLDLILYKSIGVELTFNPYQKYDPGRIAPSEIDKLLRNSLIQGYVHDRNTAFMGGVAGHSGLFGTAKDVAILLQMHLNLGSYKQQRYYQPDIISQFNQRYFDHNRRGLGWDKPGNEENGPVSHLASDETFGHTGFTGCSIWADPKENLIFVFLSNRVYPSAENNKLMDMNTRTRIQDLVYKAIMRK